METRKIPRKTFLAGLASAVVLGGASACGGGNGDTESEAIRWLNKEADPGTIKVLENAIKAYRERKGSGAKPIKLNKVSANNSVYTMVLNSISAGRSYELSSSGPLDYAGWKADGFIRPLDNLIDSLGGPDAFLPDTLPQIDGSYGFMPHNTSLYMLNYRTDWLEEIGEDIPRTWDQLKTVCQKMTRENRTGIVQPMSTGKGQTTTSTGTLVLYSNGVEFFDEDWNVILDQGEMKERCVQCLEFLQELKPYMAAGMTSIDFEGVINAFINGIAGIVPYAGRLIHNVEEAAPDLVDKIAIEGFPSPDGEKLAVYPGIEGQVVFEPAPNAAAAEEFLGWFTENRLIDFLHTVPLHLLPVQKSTYENEKWLSHPALKKYSHHLEKIQEATTSDDYIRSSIELMGPGLGKAKTELITSDVIPEMYQKVLISDTPPATAVEEAATQMREFVQGQESG